MQGNTAAVIVASVLCSNVDVVDVGIRSILVCESEGYQGHGISGFANQGGFGGIRIIKSQRPRRRRSLNNTGRLWSPKPGASTYGGKRQSWPCLKEDNLFHPYEEGKGR